MRTLIDGEEIVTPNRLRLEVAFEVTGRSLVWQGFAVGDQGDEATFRQAGLLFRAIREKRQIEFGWPPDWNALCRCGRTKREHLNSDRVPSWECRGYRSA